MELEIGGHNYRGRPLDAMKQFHIMRRLTPLFKGFVGAKGADGFFTAIADAIGQMSDADSDFIIFTCLSVVTRESGNSWAPVYTRDTLMYADMDLATILKLVSQVVTENLAGFFRDGVASLLSASQQTA